MHEICVKALERYCVRALLRSALLRLSKRSNLHKLPQVERSDTVAAVQDCEQK